MSREVINRPKRVPSFVAIKIPTLATNDIESLSIKNTASLTANSMDLLHNQETVNKEESLGYGRHDSKNQFLEEILFIKDSQNQIVSEIISLSLNENQLYAELKTDSIENITPLTDIKAITFHNFNLEKKNHLWIATVLVDV